MTNSFGVYQSYYAAHQLNSSTPSDIAWIGSFQVFCMMTGGNVAGRLFDHCGPKWLLRAFCRSCCFRSAKHIDNTFCVRVCYLVLVSLPCTALFNCANNTSFPAIGWVNHYFLKRRALVIEIIVSAASLGGLVDRLGHI
jgi:hypothetical protein